MCLNYDAMSRSRSHFEPSVSLDVVDAVLEAAQSLGPVQHEEALDQVFGVGLHVSARGQHQFVSF